MGNISSAPSAPSEFNISGKKLKLNTANDVQDLVKQIGKLKQLEKVVLSGNTFGVEASKALAEALAKHDTIKVISSQSSYHCIF